MKIINKTKIVNIIISVFLILFSKVFLASLFDFTINTNVYLLILGVIMYFIIFNPTDKQKLPINAFFLIIIFGTIISVVKPVQYGLDEESHLPNVISVSDSPIFKYSKEKLSDYDSVFAIFIFIENVRIVCTSTWLYMVVFALGLYYLCTKWKLGSDKDDRL